jgi:hypothetical protein
MSNRTLLKILALTPLVVTLLLWVILPTKSKELSLTILGNKVSAKATYGSLLIILSASSPNVYFEIEDLIISESVESEIAPRFKANPVSYWLGTFLPLAHEKNGAATFVLPLWMIALVALLFAAFLLDFRKTYLQGFFTFKRRVISCVLLTLVAFTFLSFYISASRNDISFLKPISISRDGELLIHLIKRPQDRDPNLIVAEIPYLFKLKNDTNFPTSITSHETWQVFSFDRNGLPSLLMNYKEMNGDFYNKDETNINIPIDFQPGSEYEFICYLGITLEISENSMNELTKRGSNLSFSDLAKILGNHPFQYIHNHSLPPPTILAIFQVTFHTSNGQNLCVFVSPDEIENGSGERK